MNSLIFDLNIKMTNALQELAAVFKESINSPVFIPALILWGLLIGYYFRPVSKIEMAMLIDAAGESKKAKELVSSVLWKSYVPFFRYNQVMERVRAVVRNEEANMKIDSFQFKK